MLIAKLISLRLMLPVLLLLTMSSPPALATPPRVLNIIVGEWPPFVSEQSKHYGPVAHLISDLFQEAGYSVRYHFAPWGRVYSLAAASQLYDATAVWMHKPEREKDFLFSEPVLQEQFVFFSLTSRQLNAERLAQIAGLRLGGDIAYSYGPELDAMVAEGKVSQQRVTDIKLNFGKLLRGRIDLYPQEIRVGLTALRKEFDPATAAAITHSQTPFLQNNSFVMFPRKMPDSARLQAQFNQKLQQAITSGRYQAYFDRLERGEY
ncbi:substrate-binding periplasmic protein [Aeromonas salmonicida]|uniref:Amino acid ABC transporter substrate-binding protein (PAAT family) n=1 Tax=Aeromonas salmonicida TaxID=645 RepID=A0AAX1PLH1_AERSA|nr:transporter substrate-binding domain-containing protein [Aeromonas salmonicida]RAJ06347.1 amino acid ABC transporter substrate-binding protein (PAAT family) [Aeromonas salmonicida]